MKHTIIHDTREQKPWEFKNFPVDVQAETINTGDYTLPEFCDHDSEKDTYYPNYAIERKSGPDFIDSIIPNRERFLREIKRASDWNSELLVIVEEPKMTFRRQRDFMKYRNVSSSQIFGTVESWERSYNVDFRFAGSRERAQRVAFDTLTTTLRASLLE